MEFLSSRSPFTDNIELYSIVTGVTADESVSVDCASDVGGNILQNMVDTTVDKHTFKKKKISGVLEDFMLLGREYHSLGH